MDESAMPEIDLKEFEKNIVVRGISLEDEKICTRFGIKAGRALQFFEKENAFSVRESIYIPLVKNIILLY